MQFPRTFYRNMIADYKVANKIKKNNRRETFEAVPDAQKM